MLIETKKFLQIMSNNWAFINFHFFTSENFPGIQSKVFKVKTFLIYLQLWIWNFAHFFSYKKIKKKTLFFHPSKVSFSLQTSLKAGLHDLFFLSKFAVEAGGGDTTRMHDDDEVDKKKEEGRVKGCVNRARLLAT